MGFVSWWREMYEIVGSHTSDYINLLVFLRVSGWFHCSHKKHWRHWMFATWFVTDYVQFWYSSFKILPGIPSTEEAMSSLLTAIQSSSQSQLGSQQYSECPVSEWNSGGNSTTSATSSNGQVGSVRFLYCYSIPSVGNWSESVWLRCWCSYIVTFSI